MKVISRGIIVVEKSKIPYSASWNSKLNEIKYRSKLAEREYFFAQWWKKEKKKKKKKSTLYYRFFTRNFENVLNELFHEIPLILT